MENKGTDWYNIRVLVEGFNNEIDTDITQSKSEGCTNMYGSIDYAIYFQSLYGPSTCVARNGNKI